MASRAATYGVLLAVVLLGACATAPAWVRVEQSEAKTPSDPVALELVLPEGATKDQFEKMLRLRLATHGPFARVVSKGEEAPLLLHIEPFDSRGEALAEEPKWLVVLTDSRTRRTLAMLRASGSAEGENASSPSDRRSLSLARAARAIVEAMPKPGPSSWDKSSVDMPYAAAPTATTPAPQDDDFDETTIPFEMRCLRCSVLRYETYDRLSPRENYSFNKSLAAPLLALHACVGGRRAPTMRFLFNEKGQITSASVDWDRFPLLPEEQNCLSGLPTMRPNVRLTGGGPTEIACIDQCGGL